VRVLSAHAAPGRLAVPRPRWVPRVVGGWDAGTPLWGVRWNPTYGNARDRALQYGVRAKN